MDNETLTSVFAGIRSRLISMAERMLGNEDDAADAVQDAFCRLWQHRESIGTRNEVEGVSVVTVRNLCVDSLRRSTKTAEVSIDDNRTEADGVDDGAWDEEERKAVFDEVTAIMNRHLSEEQRTIMRLREYEDFSYAEIADLLDMKEATVRVQLSRARKLVREIYRSRI